MNKLKNLLLKISENAGKSFIYYDNFYFLATAALCLLAVFYFFGADFSTLLPQDNWLANADNIFFPIEKLDTMVFPFQKLFQSIVFNHFPQNFLFLKAFIVLSPVFFAFFSAKKHSGAASLMAFILSLVLLQQEFSSFRGLEQIIISVCVLSSIALYLNFREKPGLRIVLLSISLAAMSQSKGICLPIVFIFTIWEAIRRHFSKESIYPAFLMLVPFLAAGILWNTIASQENPGQSVFFTEVGNRLLPNLSGAIIGLTGTTEGPAKDVWNGISVFQAFLIAAKTVILHPVAWGKGIFARISYLSGHYWFTLPLILGCIASIYAFRRRKDMLIMPVLAAYFFLSYIVMPVEARYFVPAYFLMGLCTATVIAEFIKNIVFSKISLKNTGKIEKKSEKYTKYAFFSFFFIPYVAIWIASIVLLAAFPYRHRNFDIDKAFARFPGNLYLYASPMRSDYPDLWDYIGRIKILSALKDGNNVAKIRWMEYFAASQLSENNQNIYKAGTSPENYSQKETVYWQDIFLDSVINYKAGNMNEARSLSSAAAIACMTSKGYVRKYGGSEQYSKEEKEYSDRLAYNSAKICRDDFSDMFFSIPPWESSIKTIMLENGFSDYLSEEKLKKLFDERNEPSCTECCVPGAFLSAPSKCGMDGIRVESAHSRIDEGTRYSGILCHRDRKPLNTMEAELMINFCTRFYDKISDADIYLAENFPVLENLPEFIQKDMSAFAISNAYASKKDYKKAAEWLRKR